jgi:hypothetical protein
MGLNQYLALRLRPQGPADAELATDPDPSVTVAGPRTLPIATSAGRQAEAVAIGSVLGPS